MFEFFLIILLFSLYYLETFISITDLQLTNIPFKDGYCNYTLIYNFTGSSIFTNKKLQIKTIGLKSNQYFFIYDDLEKLLKDKEKYSFDNYFLRGSTNNNISYYEHDLNNYNKDKTFYITFDSKTHSGSNKDTYNFSFMIYSTVLDSYVNKSINFSDKKLNFLFFIPQKSKKYSNFGFKIMSDNVLGELQIFDVTNYQLIHSIKQIDYFEYSFETKSTNSYTANLTLTSNSQNNDINKIYFYFFNSDENNEYKEIVYLKDPVNATKVFFVLRDLKLLLDITQVPAYSKVYFGYAWEYSYDSSFNAFGYTDKELIYNQEEGEDLYINEDETCANEKTMCEDFFRKKYKGLNFAVLKISPKKGNYYEIYNFTIKYGYSYEYSSGLPFYATLIGIAFFIPNIIIQCVYCNKYQCEGRGSVLFGYLDIMFLVGFSNFISLYLYIGGHFGFYVGIVILALDGLFSFCLYIYLLRRKFEHTTGWVYLLRKLFLPSVNKAINENAKLPPYIILKARIFHFESREVCKKFRKVNIYGDSEFYYEKDEYGKDLVKKERLPFLRTDRLLVDTFYSDWGRVDEGGGKFKEKYVSSGEIEYEITSEVREVDTSKDEKELEYGSWKDDTEYIPKYKSPVLIINFRSKLNLNDDIKKDYENLIAEMGKEGLIKDSETEVFDNSIIPEFKDRIICRPQGTFCKDLICLFIAFIFSIIGYSSIVNFFVYYDEIIVDVTILKSISSSNIYNNPYKKKNIIDDRINISSNKDINNSDSDNIYQPLMEMK